jgi:hypothetical protein
MANALRGGTSQTPGPRVNGGITAAGCGPAIITLTREQPASYRSKPLISIHIAPSSASCRIGHRVGPKSHGQRPSRLSTLSGTGTALIPGKPEDGILLCA